MPATEQRAEPHSLHVVAAEAKENREKAIRYVMAENNVPYPEAVKIVDVKGVSAVLAAHEKRDEAQHQASLAAQALAQRFSKPGELNKFVAELDARVSALEAAKSEPEA